MPSSSRRNNLFRLDHWTYCGFEKSEAQSGIAETLEVYKRRVAENGWEIVRPPVVRVQTRLFDDKLDMMVRALVRTKAQN